MTLVTCHMSISVDGYTAGPNQSLEHPLGEGGEQLHEWFFGVEEPHPVDAEMAARILRGSGAHIMGRHMFGGGDGPWDMSWRGWWGDEPPYHAPVFVLTHHPREPLVMDGGTTFNFITGGVEEALQRARAAAGDKYVSVAGGAHTLQQFLSAGLLDELFLHISPVVLGAGERLLEGIGQPSLEQLESVGSPVATHVRYGVRH